MNEKLRRLLVAARVYSRTNRDGHEDPKVSEARAAAYIRAESELCEAAEEWEADGCPGLDG